MGVCGLALNGWVWVGGEWVCVGEGEWDCGRGVNWCVWVNGCVDVWVNGGVCWG